MSALAVIAACLAFIAAMITAGACLQYRRYHAKYLSVARPLCEAGAYRVSFFLRTLLLSGKVGGRTMRYSVYRGREERPGQLIPAPRISRPGQFPVLPGRRYRPARRSLAGGYGRPLRCGRFPGAFRHLCAHAAARAADREAPRLCLQPRPPSLEMGRRCVRPGGDPRRPRKADGACGARRLTGRATRRALFAAVKSLIILYIPHRGVIQLAQNIGLAFFNAQSLRDLKGGVDHGHGDQGQI